MRMKQILTFDHIIGLCGIVLLGSMIINCFYAQPSADDYSFITSIQDHTPWTFLVDYYTGSGGRYSGALVYGLIYKAYSVVPFFDFFDFYWVVPLIGILLTAGSLLYFLYTVFNSVANQEAGSRPLLWKTCALLGVVYLLTSTTWVFYWTPAVVIHIFPFCILLLLCSFIMRVTTRTAAHRSPFYTALIALITINGAFLVAGFNQSIMLTQVLFLGCGALYTLIHKKNSVWWLCALAAAIIGVVVAIRAPGNAARFQSFTDMGFNSPQVLSIILGVERTGEVAFLARLKLLLRVLILSSVKIHGNVLVAYAAFYLIPASRSMLRQYAEYCLRAFSNRPQLWNLFWIVGYIALPAFIILPYADSAGEIGPARLRAQAFFFMIVIFPLFERAIATVCTTLLKREWVQRMRLSVQLGKLRNVMTHTRWLHVIRSIVIIIAILIIALHAFGLPDGLALQVSDTFGNPYLVIRDTFYTGPRYRRAFEDRYHLLQASVGKDVIIKPIYPIAHSIHFTDGVDGFDPFGGYYDLVVEYFNLASYTIVP